MCGKLDAQTIEAIEKALHDAGRVEILQTKDGIKVFVYKRKEIRITSPVCK